MELTFHRLVKTDLKRILDYYCEQGGGVLADQFFQEFERLVHEVGNTPCRFHPMAGSLRRANFRRFPYHVLYREGSGKVRILVLRHHKRHPDYGINRS